MLKKNIVCISLFLILLAAGTGVAQEALIVPSDNLVTEGIPNIPASMAEDVGRYTKGRAAEVLSWHPTKREMLIVTSFGNTPQVHLVKSPGAARTQLTFYEDRVGSGVSYDPRRGSFFVFRKDIGGDQNYQNYRYTFPTGAVTLLTDGKSKNSSGVWSHAGDRQVYSSTRRTGKDVDLYVIDPSKPESDRMLAQLEGGGWSALDWSPDDQKILALEYISINESYLWLIDVASGTKSLVTPKGGSQKIAYGNARFSKDGKGVYAITDKDSEFRRLVFIDLATRQHRVLTGHINWDIYEFALSPNHKLLAFVANEDGLLTLHLLDTITGKEKSLPNLPTGYVLGLYWHKNSRDLGFTLDSARSTSDAYSLDAITGRVSRWTHSETGGLDTSGFVDPQLIHWKSFDGRTISGFLYRPPARFTGKRPVIINIHGGPEDQFQPYYLGRQNYYLNELGVSLLFPNIRGSSGYGKSFLKLDNEYLREDAYKDIGALLDWIKTRPELDADRVMLTGVSYGGHMVLATLVRYGDRIRCAVDIVGPSNLVTFLENTAGYRQNLRRVEYGDERDPKMREFLERISPIKSVSQIKKPLFVIQGKNDPIVPLSEAEQIVKAVRATGAPVWYLMAKDEGHGFSKRSNANFQFYATVLFVREYLLNQ